jgi:hypothetical protein
LSGFLGSLDVGLALCEQSDIVLRGHDEGYLRLQSQRREGTNKPFGQSESGAAMTEGESARLTV